MAAMKRNRYAAFGAGLARGTKKVATGLASMSSLPLFMYGAYKGGGRKYVAARTVRRGRDGLGTTQQHDVKDMYSKRSKPRYLRKRWKKFSKKTRSVILKSVAPINLVRNQIQNYSAAAGSQLVFSVGNMFGFGNATFLEDDYARVIFDSTQITSSATAGVVDSTHAANQRVFVKTCQSDFTFENSTNVAGTGVDLEVDLYELICTKDVYTDDTGGPTTQTLDGWITYVNNLNLRPQALEDQNNPLLFNAVGTATMGWTPFENSHLLRFFKVLSKKKYYMTPNGHFTYTMKTRSHWIKGDDLFVGTGATGSISSLVKPLAIKGLTKVLICVCKGEPSNISGSFNWAAPAVIMGQTKVLHYKIDQRSQTRTYNN